MKTCHRKSCCSSRMRMRPARGRLPSRPARPGDRERKNEQTGQVWIFFLDSTRVQSITAQAEAHRRPRESF
ncbi:hypothetical protein SXCC_01505 [Gluconacetobacter sp. SXCC-1]|nr:hypothetical protein SXCC_01505 [Gluconacetobacter sp. SXCC-1]